MITLKKLKWSNMFSYGPNNEVTLDNAQITQIIGSNGHGKSSIPLILEETLFNKNSKGIKKANILNRYIEDNKYNNYLEFDKDGDTYIVSSSRASTQSIKILKNGEDISSHTATATFSALENILGLDHRAFTQLVYQSSSKSLEFLTATDTIRKKFLIDLLDLSKYMDLFDKLKVSAKQVNEDLISTKRSVDMVQSWLDKNTNIDLSLKDIEVPPDIPSAEITRLNILQTELVSADEINNSRIKNAQYKSQLDKIDVSQATKVLPGPINTKSLEATITEQLKVVRDANTLITKMSALGDTCPTCMQSVSNDFILSLLTEHREVKSGAESLIKSITKELEQAELVNKSITDRDNLKAKWESYYALYNSAIPAELVEKSDLSTRITELVKHIDAVKSTISKVEARNREVSAHNAKVKVVMEQISSMQEDLSKYTNSLQALTSRNSNLAILQKAFSTNGLVAYKIEGMVKDLEILVNEYLADLSSGRFQLTFRVASDKLNVIITDNGKDIDIQALSNGELARVNTATLLAIRKLMQQLSSTKINLLVLDETIDSLDVDGKEKLVEVLLREEHLNTFLISHGYSHPLLEKLSVIKEHNISRIE